MTVAVEVRSDDVATIDQIAVNLQTDRSAVLAQAIEQYLAYYESLKQSVAKADEDIAAGRFYTHEQVESMVEEWTRTAKAA